MKQNAIYLVDDFSGSVSALLFTQELEGTKRRGRLRKGWKGEVERDLQSAASEKMERVDGRWEKNGRTLFDRPKPTVGCSANGRSVCLARISFH